MAERAVAAVVVTYDALPWLEPCLESLRGVETVVVDHGSGDGTLELVRESFPEVGLVEQPNLGLAAGWNRGFAETESRYVLLLNADAWLVGDALERLVAFADARPDAAVVGPRLLNPDGTLQRSVRGFPTVWRLATEYLFLRKLAPSSRVLNAFYGAGFAHDEPRDADFLMGACLLVRREAVEEVGPADERYFLFSEEVDWCFRFRRAGWRVVFTPSAECVHVGGAAHGGRLLRENVRGHLLFLDTHRGRGQAERARRLLRAALRLRGALFPGPRGRAYREAAAWLGSGGVPDLLGETGR
jgi:GT2 family glycosyltransferase